MNEVFGGIIGLIEWLVYHWLIIRVVLGIISIALLVLIAWYMRFVDYFGDSKKYGLRAAYDYEKTGRKEYGQQWGKIVKLIDSPDSNHWKKAVTSADTLLVGVLHAAGYRGVSADQLLAVLDDSMVVGIDSLKKERAEWVAAIARGEGDVQVREAKQALRAYREVLRGFGIVD